MPWDNKEGEGTPWGALIGVGLVLGVILLIFCIFTVFFIVRAGEVGVRFDPFGNYQVFDEDTDQWIISSVRPAEYGEGFHMKAPWVKIDKFNVKTQDYTMSSVVEEGQVKGPDAIKTVTSEGLYVILDMTVLYRASSSITDEIRRDIGKDGEYQEIVVRPTIRSIIREVVSRYEASAVYGQSRGAVEIEIFDSLASNLEPRGIIIERVLLRDVTLPVLLTQAIEQKKQAEQEALRMLYVLEKEALEKDRKIIEAAGIAGANEIIADSLSVSYLQWYWINSLGNHNSVIYVPAEGGLPILTKDIDKPIPTPNPTPTPNPSPSPR